MALDKPIKLAGALSGDLYTLAQFDQWIEVLYNKINDLEQRIKTLEEGM